MKTTELIGRTLHIVFLLFKEVMAAIVMHFVGRAGEVGKL